MNNYYYTKYIKVKQIIKNKMVLGNITLTSHAYGYKVQLHYFNVPGYVINELFNTEQKAMSFFEKTYTEITNNIKRTEE